MKKNLKYYLTSINCGDQVRDLWNSSLKTCMVMLAMMVSVGVYAQITVTPTDATCRQNGELSWTAATGANVSYNVSGTELDGDTYMISLPSTSLSLTGLEPGSYTVTPIVDGVEGVAEPATIADAFDPLEVELSTSYTCGYQIDVNVLSGDLASIQVLSGPGSPMVNGIVSITDVEYPETYELLFTDSCGETSQIDYTIEFLFPTRLGVGNTECNIGLNCNSIEYSVAPVGDRPGERPVSFEYLVNGVVVASGQNNGTTFTGTIPITCEDEVVFDIKATLNCGTVLTKEVTLVNEVIVKDIPENCNDCIYLSVPFSTGGLTTITYTKAPSAMNLEGTSFTQMGSVCEVGTTRDDYVDYELCAAGPFEEGDYEVTINDGCCSRTVTFNYVTPQAGVSAVIRYSCTDGKGLLNVASSTGFVDADILDLNGNIVGSLDCPRNDGSGFLTTELDYGTYNIEILNTCGDIITEQVTLQERSWELGANITLGCGSFNVEIRDDGQFAPVGGTSGSAANFAYFVEWESPTGVWDTLASRGNISWGGVISLDNITELGNFRLRRTQVNTCSNCDDLIFFTQNNNELDFTTLEGVQCSDGGLYTINASALGEPLAGDDITYEVYDSGNNLVSSGGAESGQNFTASNLAEGTYTVVASNDCGSQIREIELVDLPPLMIEGEASYCEGSDATLSIGGFSFLDFEWIFNGIVVGNMSTLNLTAVNASNAGIYFVKATSAGNDCISELLPFELVVENCDCDPGYYKDENGVCFECPPGSFCPGDNEKYPCLAGYFSSESGAESCTACPEGTFQSDTGQEVCYTCLAGTFSDTPGATECTTCTAIENCNSITTCSNATDSQCSECASGYQLEQALTDICIDIDECADGTNNCHPNATCTNTEGSFGCECNEGYYGDGETCTPCSTPGPGEYVAVPCTSTTDAVIETCTAIENCSIVTCTSAFDSQCTECANGYQLENGVCVDIDGCAPENGNCAETCTSGGDSAAECIDSAAPADGNSCGCVCSLGFEEVNGICVEIDDCVANPCQNGTCSDGDNTFQCDCFEGYYYFNTSICIPCELGNGCLSCDPTTGECLTCPEGYEVDPDNPTGCREIEKCYADIVITSGTDASCATTNNPNASIGAPNYTTTTSSNAINEYYSIGESGNCLTLAFTDNQLTNDGTSDTDLFIYEVGPAIEGTEIKLLSCNGATELAMLNGGYMQDAITGFFILGEIGGATQELDIDALFANATTVAGDLQFCQIQLCNINDDTCPASTAGPDIDAVCALSSFDCNDEDADGDGFTQCGGDCNDNDATVFPGAMEICNDDIDNNCNGIVDEIEEEEPIAMNCWDEFVYDGNICAWTNIGSSALPVKFFEVDLTQVSCDGTAVFRVQTDSFGDLDGNELSTITYEINGVTNTATFGTADQIMDGLSGSFFYQLDIVVPNITMSTTVELISQEYGDCLILIDNLSQTVTVNPDTQGCTNPNSANYDPTAVCDDGSCIPCPSPNSANIYMVVGQSTVDCSGDDAEVCFVVDGTNSEVFDVTVVYTVDGIENTVVIPFDGSVSVTSKVTVTLANITDATIVSLVSAYLIPNCPIDNYVVQSTDILTVSLNTPVGCTNPNSANYDPTAVCDDGSCIPCPSPNYANISMVVGQSSVVCSGDDADVCFVVAGTNSEVFDVTVVYTVDGVENTAIIEFDGSVSTSSKVTVTLANITDATIVSLVSAYLIPNCPIDNYVVQSTETINVDPNSVEGCTDPTAINYNPAATCDDGSCEDDPCLGINPVTPTLTVSSNMLCEGELLEVCVTGEPNAEYGLTEDGDISPWIGAIFRTDENGLACETFTLLGPGSGIFNLVSYREGDCVIRYEGLGISELVTVSPAPDEPEAVNCWDDFQLDAASCTYVNQGVQNIHSVQITVDRSEDPGCDGSGRFCFTVLSSQDPASFNPVTIDYIVAGQPAPMAVVVSGTDFFTQATAGANAGLYYYRACGQSYSLADQDEYIFESYSATDGTCTQSGATPKLLIERYTRRPIEQMFTDVSEVTCGGNATVCFISGGSNSESYLVEFVYEVNGVPFNETIDGDLDQLTNDDRQKCVTLSNLTETTTINLISSVENFTCPIFYDFSETITVTNSGILVKGQIRPDGGIWSFTNHHTATVGDRVGLAAHPVDANGYTWTGPNGFSSNERNFYLDPITADMAGDYTVTYTSPDGCSGSDIITLEVLSITPPDAPTCTSSFVYDNNIQIDGTTVTADLKLLSNSANITSYLIPTSSYPAEFGGPVTISIPEAISWDGYLNRVANNQSFEQWKVVFITDGQVAYETGYTDDLADNVMSAQWTGSLMGDVVFPNGVDEIYIVQYEDATYGEGPQPTANSVIPSHICFDFEACISPIVTGQIRPDGGSWTFTNYHTATVGDRVGLAAHPVDANGYTWTGPNGFSSNERNFFLDPITADMAGDYTVTYTSPDGCSGSDIITLEVLSITPPDAPTCTSSFVYDNNIQIDGTTVTADLKLLSNSANVTSYLIPTYSYPAEFGGPVTISIPEAISWDGYLNRVANNQSFEQWKVVFITDGQVAYETGYTEDLEDNVISSQWTGSLMGDVLFPNGVDEIHIVQYEDATYGEGPQPTANSVIPSHICFDFDATEVVDCTIEHTDNFDGGFGYWNDGGADCGFISAAPTGSASIRLRDNSGSASSTFTDALDFSSATSLNVSFDYLPVSFETNEDFYLEYSTDGGSSWTVAQQWVVNTDFNNNQSYSEVVSIDGPFTTQTSIRFRCDASGNADEVYLDNIVLETCTDSDGGPAPTCDGMIVGFELDPLNNSLIALTEGMVLCGEEFANTDVRIAVSAEGQHESMEIHLVTPNGTYTRVENALAYESDYFSANDAGLYTITAKLYSEDNLGGLLCAEQTLSFTIDESACGECFNEYNYEGFEQNLGIWNDGGTDVFHNFEAGSGYNGSDYNILLRDNSGVGSSLFTDKLDFSNVSEVKVEFNFEVESFEANEDFMLEYSLDDGATWTIVQSWVVSFDFYNGQPYYSEFVTINTGFTDSTRFRFRSDASGNADRLYIDDVTIKICGSAPALAISGNNGSINVDQAAMLELRSEVTLDMLKVYPNPAMEQINIEGLNGSTYEIYNMVGQRVIKQSTEAKVNLHTLDHGTYLLRTSDGRIQRFTKL